MKKILLLIGGLALTGALGAKPTVPTPVKNEVQFTGEFILAKDATTLSELTKQVVPNYPVQMRQAHLTGEAQIAFLIDEKGRTEQVQVLSASDASFGDAAVAAVKKWRFKPGKKDGKTVKIATAMPVSFRLDE